MNKQELDYRNKVCNNGIINVLYSTWAALSNNPHELPRTRDCPRVSTISIFMNIKIQYESLSISWHNISATLIIRVTWAIKATLQAGHALRQVKLGPLCGYCIKTHLYTCPLSTGIVGLHVHVEHFNVQLNDVILLSMVLWGFQNANEKSISPGRTAAPNLAQDFYITDDKNV